VISGLSKLNLEPDQEAYLLQCLTEGKTWFVTRKRDSKRCIQASGESLERVIRTHKGWPGSSLIQIVAGSVVWHKGEL